MFDDVVQDVRAHVEGFVSTTMGEVEEHLSGLLSGCAKETCVREESVVLKVLVAGAETLFREGHVAHVEAINEQKSMTNVQTSLPVALCGEVKVLNEKIDILCSHTERLGHIEWDVAAISSSVPSVEKKTDTVTLDISNLQER